MSRLQQERVDPQRRYRSRLQHTSLLYIGLSFISLSFVGSSLHLFMILCNKPACRINQLPVCLGKVKTLEYHHTCFRKPEALSPVYQSTSFPLFIRYELRVTTLPVRLFCLSIVFTLQLVTATVYWGVCHGVNFGSRQISLFSSTRSIRIALLSNYFGSSLWPRQRTTGSSPSCPAMRSLRTSKGR